MQLINALSSPITKNELYTSIYTNSFDTNHWTFADIKMLGQFEQAQHFLEIGSELPAQDPSNNNNPWIVVHIGNATIVNEDTHSDELWKGVFLQQKYYMNPGLTLSTATGASTLTDRLGFGSVLATQLGLENYASSFKHSLFGYQKVWMPIQAQVMYNGAQRFDYYSKNYASRIQSASSSTPQTPMGCSGTAIVYASSMTQGFSYCSSSATSVSGSTLNFTSTFYPRMCCFIKWHKVEE